MNRWQEAGFPQSYGRCDGFVRAGEVIRVGSETIALRMRGLTSGSLVSIEARDGSLQPAVAEAVSDLEAVCTPIGQVADVATGAHATSVLSRPGSYCGFGLLGCSVDAWGRPATPDCVVREQAQPLLSLSRRRPITEPLMTGIAAIDGLCSLGMGQRVAVLSGAGVGKTTLLRQMGECVSLDAHVMALIGERGREAAETLAALRAGPSWKRTTLVCATAGTPPAERLAAVHTAIAQAEFLCESGYNVLLTVDSLTRVANAWRERSLARGEPAAHRGHPASMASTLATIVERAGVRERGSITAIFAVLVDADDPLEPVTDTLRGLLDGHIVLSRRLAETGSFPAIDVLRSSSRIMSRIASAEHMQDAASVRTALAALERAEDLFAIGAYVAGGDPVLDAAVAHRERIDRFLYRGDGFSRNPAAELAALACELRRASSPSAAPKTIKSATQQ